MKKKILLLFLFISSIFIISSCGKSKSNTNSIDNLVPSKYINVDVDNYEIPISNNPDGIKIIYDCNNGFKYESTTNKNNKIERPSKDPYKVASEFKGWYIDEACKKRFNFETRITKETTIYAGYDIDYAELTNQIYQQKITSNVKVIAISTTATGKKETTGSGAVISKYGTKYYALTNNHVIVRENNAISIRYEIVDCYGNTYNGYVIDNDVNYDLALIEFSNIDIDGETITKKLNPITFSNFLPKTDEKIIALGNPTTITNSTSYGTYSGLIKYSADETTRDKSNINFDVIKHEAIIDSGSSGGMLLDTNLRLIGINFACKVDSNDNYVYSLSIPLEKVIEYVRNYESKERN